MGDFIQTIAGGISGLVTGSLRAIGDALRGIWTSAESTLPGGMLFVVIFAVLLVAGWSLARR